MKLRKRKQIDGHRETVTVKILGIDAKVRVSGPEIRSNPNRPDYYLATSWVAGLVGQGSTREEAEADLQNRICLWLVQQLEDKLRKGGWQST